MSDGRQIKGGIVIHPIIATALVGVIVAIGLGLRSEMNWQHDQIVVIATQKADAEKARESEAAAAQRDREANEAWRLTMSNRMTKLEYASAARLTKSQ